MRLASVYHPIVSPEGDFKFPTISLMPFAISANANGRTLSRCPLYQPPGRKWKNMFAFLFIYLFFSKFLIAGINEHFLRRICMLIAIFNNLQFELTLNEISIEQ